MAFKFKGKEMYPIFVSAVLLVNSLQSGKAWQACAQQTEKRQSHTSSEDSRRQKIHAGSLKFGFRFHIYSLRSKRVTNTTMFFLIFGTNCSGAGAKTSRCWSRSRSQTF